MKPPEKTMPLERRAYKRVAMKHSSFSCRVEEEDRSCQLTNLSLSGCYLEYSSELKKGDTPTVTITSNDDIFSTPLNLATKVIRVGKNSAGLKFLKTTEDDYMTLQAILLYHSQEPHLMAIEFPEQPHLAEA